MFTLKYRLTDRSNFDRTLRYPGVSFVEALQHVKRLLSVQPEQLFNYKEWFFEVSDEETDLIHCMFWLHMERFPEQDTYACAVSWWSDGPPKHGFDYVSPRAAIYSVLGVFAEELDIPTYEGYSLGVATHISALPFFTATKLYTPASLENFGTVEDK